MSNDDERDAYPERFLQWLNGEYFWPPKSATRRPELSHEQFHAMAADVFASFVCSRATSMNSIDFDGLWRVRVFESNSGEPTLDRAFSKRLEPDQLKEKLRAAFAEAFPREETKR